MVVQRTGLVSTHYWLTIVISLLQIPLDATAQPHVYLMESPNGPTDYLTVLDSDGAVIDRTGINSRFSGFSLATDGRTLIGSHGVPGNPGVGEWRLSRFLPDGDVVEEIFSYEDHAATYFAVDSANNFYLSYSAPRTQGLGRVNDEGEEVWFLPGSNFKGVAMFHETLYVARQRCCMPSPGMDVQRYSMDGTLLGEQFLDFEWVGGMAVDEPANILYLSQQTGQIKAFEISDTGLEFLDEFDTELGSLLNIAVDHFSGNLLIASFSGVAEFTPSGEQLFLYQSSSLTAVPATNFAASADLDLDRRLGTADLDLLVDFIATGRYASEFDLNNDDGLDLEDVSMWLDFASRVNHANYVAGDIDLDGVVDVHDFNIWNTHKFTTTAKWSEGDLNADGVVDVLDFQVWDNHKFSTNSPTLVPEPSGLALSIWMLTLLSISRKSPLRPSPSSFAE